MYDGGQDKAGKQDFDWKDVVALTIAVYQILLPWVLGLVAAVVLVMVLIFFFLH